MAIQQKPINGVLPYDLFIVCLTLLSFFNIIFYIVLSDQAILYVVGIIDLLISVVFLVDFARRLFRAKNKRRYFFSEYGWADLLASVPFPQFKILRMFRLVRTFGVIQKTGLKKLLRKMKERRASGAVYLLFFMIILLLEFGSIAVLFAESVNPRANITSASDAIWWVYVTITTVGYGDKYPITNAGRLVGIVVMLVGVGLFGVVTGYLANKFLPTKEEQKDNSVNDELTQLRGEVSEIKALVEKLVKDK